MYRMPSNIPKWVCRSSRAQPESRIAEAGTLPGSSLLQHFQALHPLGELGECLKTQNILGPPSALLHSLGWGYFAPRF